MGSEVSRCTCGCGEDPEETLNSPVMVSPLQKTYDEATAGARDLDDVRRERIAAVRESEHNFLREFAAMMRTGLRVLRDGTQATLRLVRTDLALALDCSGTVLLLDNVATLRADADAVVINDWRLSLESADVSKLLVDGLAMLVKRERNLLLYKKGKTSSASPSAKIPPPPHPPLSDATNLPLLK